MHERDNDFFLARRSEFCVASVLFSISNKDREVAVSEKENTGILHFIVLFKELHR